ncbi:YMGG-like glycine zipper-containing protein [Hymenobacter tibetensis]|uniref:YMGG-like glycine zipper-containing protein n=1 Tax=Hymenobacter tibetensis TaxID=497967 RepID=A0ABY4CZU4_9BACT|nr:YMGG-like glycine zipper-containing protein [Hymenobacter tibetensis]UOG75673.1 YMGG-like glycine zipper-containing protein [Hymenobacter tibetensis]
MKTFKIYVTMLSAALMLGGTLAAPEAAAQTATRKGWSKKAKGAAIGGGTGAVAGAVIAGKGDRGTGAVVGGAAGAVGGALIGRKKDKKKDPVRYQQYSRKD